MIIQHLVNRQFRSLLSAVLACFLFLGATWLILDNLKRNQSLIFRIYDVTKYKKPTIHTPEDLLEEGCEVFEGKWVWDNISHPLYKEENCPYLLRFTACQRTGRPDSFYQNWKWKPNGCNLPRFDPLNLLTLLKGKRMMFIGDSIQRSQFDSLVCMVESLISEGKKSFIKAPPMMIFKIEEFNASIEFYWAPFIVESMSDDAENHTVKERFVRLGSIAKHAEHWQGVDILVFGSYAWWFYKPFISAVYQGDIKEYKCDDAYKLALRTWVNWLENNINPRMQQVFFTNLSPTHWRSTNGLPGSKGNCFNETYPIVNSQWGTGVYLPMMTIVGDILKEAKIKITLLNITQLSDHRVDAHTTIFGEYKGKPLTKEQKANPDMFSDCLHWCLPGVPDTWNEILYAYLMKNYQIL